MRFLNLGIQLLAGLTGLGSVFASPVLKNDIERRRGHEKRDDQYTTNTVQVIAQNYISTATDFLYEVTCQWDSGNNCDYNVPFIHFFVR